MDRGKLGHYHLKGGGGINASDRAEVIWTEPAVVAVENGAPIYVGQALRAAVETGLRPGDLIRLSKNHIMLTPNGRRIQIRANKKGRMASIPVTQKMAEIIDTTPGLVILANSKGLPWTEETLSKAVLRVRRTANLRNELRLYDARGSATTRLVAAGASLGGIAVHMGWSVKTAAQMIETYAALNPAISDSVLGKLARLEDKA